MKKLKWILIGLLILAVLALIYFKVIKPSMDRKREAQRKRETDIVTAAQAPPPAPAPVTNIVSNQQPVDPANPLVGIGGTPIPVTVDAVITSPTTTTSGPVVYDATMGSR